MSLEDEDFFVIEGMIEHVEVAKTKTDLLRKIESGLTGKLFVGAAAGLYGNMLAAPAHSAALCFYDGEDSFNFSGLIGDKLVAGNFARADCIKSGDLVRAVVSKREQALFVHAILNTSGNLLYLPIGMFSGTRALFLSCMKVAFWFWISTSVFIAIAMYANYDDSMRDPEGLVRYLGCAAVFSLISFVIFEYWTYRTFRGFGLIANEIFRKLGFKSPSGVNLLKTAKMHKGPEGWVDAWDCGTQRFRR